MQRRMATIMMADIADYTQLVTANEEAAVERMLRLRRNIIQPLVAAYNGRVIDYAGDGAFVEFGDAPSAMSCAIAIQRKLAAEQAHFHEQDRFRLRIGLNKGDVLVTETGIAGRHVNITARLEALADPGGICFSKSVYQATIRHGGCEDVERTDNRFSYGGRPPLKHILEQIDVWFWSEAPIITNRCRRYKRAGRSAKQNRQNITDSDIGASLAHYHGIHGYRLFVHAGPCV